MSTIIHNGYELPPHKDLESLISWSKQVRERLTQCAKEHLTQQVLRRAVGLFDEASLLSQGYPLRLQLEGLEDGCLSRALRSFQDEVKEARLENRRCILEPNTSLAVLPDGDRLFGLLYCEIPEVQKAFAQEPGVVGYAYSNQTDGPEDMTHEQWAARGEHWDRLLGQSGVPAHVSTTISLVSEQLIYQLDFPSDATPVQVFEGPKVLRRRAEHLAIHTDAARLPDDMQAAYEKSRGLGIWMRHHMNLMDGKVPAFNEEVQAIMSRLVEAPTIQDLKRSFQISANPGPRPG